ncbi:MAG: hypothetical protein ACREC6_11575, partial [Hyphomicrobiaceae bacterium]
AVFAMRPVCYGAQRMPVYRTGESLVFKAAVRNAGIVGRMLGYRYTVVGISEHTGVKVFHEGTFGRPIPTARPGMRAPPPPEAEAGKLSLVLPIDGLTEKNKLIVLARRLTAIDAADLKVKLETPVAGKSPDERINAVVAYLASFAPGYLDYSFLSTQEPQPCAPR